MWGYPVLLLFFPHKKGRRGENLPQQKIKASYSRWGRQATHFAFFLLFVFVLRRPGSSRRGCIDFLWPERVFWLFRFVLFCCARACCSLLVLWFCVLLVLLSFWVPVRCAASFRFSFGCLYLTESACCKFWSWTRDLSVVEKCHFEKSHCLVAAQLFQCHSSWDRCAFKNGFAHCPPAASRGHADLESLDCMMSRLLSIPPCPVIMFAEKFHMGSGRLYFILRETMAAGDEPVVIESDELAIIQVPCAKFEAMKDSEWALAVASKLRLSAVELFCVLPTWPPDPPSARLLSKKSAFSTRGWCGSARRSAFNLHLPPVFVRADFPWSRWEFCEETIPKASKLFIYIYIGSSILLLFCHSSREPLHAKTSTWIQ